MEGIRDRHGVTVLTVDECWERLSSQPVGRVAFVDAGVPVIVPVNHLVDGHSIYFRSAVGAKLDAAERGHVFGVEVDEIVPARETGWSVLASGPATIVDDPVEEARLDRLGDAPWALRDRDVDMRWVRVRVEALTGRRAGPP